MKNQIGAPCCVAHCLIVADVGLTELHPGILPMVSDVGEPAAKQVIQDEDVAPAIRHQAIGEVAADETGAAGHEDFHDLLSLLTVWAFDARQLLHRGSSLHGCGAKLRVQTA